MRTLCSRLAPVSLALCIATLGVVATGCASPPPRGLTKLKVPDQGVQLMYRLAPGTALAGHLRLGKTRQIDGLDQPLSQSVECDVTLLVAPRSQEGAVRLGASFANVDLAWGLPPASGFGSDEFREAAMQSLREYRGWIEIDDRGRIVAVSALPERMAPELAELHAALMDTVAASFVPAPDHAIERGDAWEESLTGTGRKGLVQATLRGLFQHKERDEPVALLELAYEDELATATETGSETQGRRGQAQVLYATDGGYVAEVDRELSAFAPSLGMTYEKLRVTWQAARGMSNPEAVETIDDVQIIADPCNPDYVGPERCPTELTPLPEDAAAPNTQQDAKPKTKASGASESGAPETDAPETDASETGASKTDASKTAPSAPPAAEPPPTKSSAATEAPAAKPDSTAKASPG